VKECVRCKDPKDESEFSRSRSRKDGLHPYCKSCVKEYRDDPDNKRRTAEYNQNYIANNQEKRRAAYRLARYGKTDAELSQMLEDQLHECANQGCRDPITLASSHVDHDRSCCPGRTSCGKCVRGLLCPGCNQGLGHYRDDPSRLRGMADYVERHAVDR